MEKKNEDINNREEISTLNTDCIYTVNYFLKQYLVLLFDFFSFWVNINVV